MTADLSQREASSFALIHLSHSAGKESAYKKKKKKSAYNAGDLGLVPGLGRSPEEGKGYPLQYSCLENSMDCIIHGIAKSQTLLSAFHTSLLS